MALPNRKGKPDLSLPDLDDEIVKDDSDFSSVSDDEIIDVNIEIDEPEEKEKPKKKKSSDPFYKDLRKKDKYIDKKKKKIIPIGTKKEIKEIDSRKNINISLKIFRLFIYLVFIGLFVLGIKNSFWPNNNYTKSEIEEIATNATGQSGFPLLRGQAFAEEFLKYYLNFNGNDSVTNQVLNRFYSGTTTQSSNSKDRTVAVSDKNKQRVIGDPITFETSSPLDYIATYKISTLVTDDNGSTVNNEAKLSAHWVSFAVNVYYDKETNRLSIHKDSPTLIPTYEIMSAQEIPVEGQIGNGQLDETKGKEMLPTITGFLNAYAKSSYTSHDELVQYVPKNADSTLLSGFGGSVKLSGSTAVETKTYKTNTNGEWKVDLKVSWQDATATNQATAPIYIARYIMTIESTSDGKFVVTKFAPYVYTQKS